MKFDLNGNSNLVLTTLTKESGVKGPTGCNSEVLFVKCPSSKPLLASCLQNSAPTRKALPLCGISSGQVLSHQSNLVIGNWKSVSIIKSVSQSKLYFSDFKVKIIRSPTSWFLFQKLRLAIWKSADYGMLNTQSSGKPSKPFLTVLRESCYHTHTVIGRLLNPFWLDGLTIQQFVLRRY